MRDFLSQFFLTTTTTTGGKARLSWKRCTPAARVSLTALLGSTTKPIAGVFVCGMGPLPFLWHIRMHFLCNSSRKARPTEPGRVTSCLFSKIWSKLPSLLVLSVYQGPWNWNHCRVASYYDTTSSRRLQIYLFELVVVGKVPMPSYLLACSPCASLAA